MLVPPRGRRDTLSRRPPVSPGGGVSGGGGAGGRGAGSTQAHWPFPAGHLVQAYAYILTHPGTPCVFYDHLFSDGGRPARSFFGSLRRLLSGGSAARVPLQLAPPPAPGAALVWVHRSVASVSSGTQHGTARSSKPSGQPSRWPHQLLASSIIGLLLCQRHVSHEGGCPVYPECWLPGPPPLVDVHRVPARCTPRRESAFKARCAAFRLQCAYCN